MKVAYLGVKDIPASAGADRVVEALAIRMQDKGVEPVIYCDRFGKARAGSLPGVELIRLPALPGKYTRATTLNVLAALHAVFLGNYDLIHLHNVEASYVLPILRLRYKVISTSHGAAYWRAKWGIIAKKAMQLMDWPFIKFSNEVTFVSRKDAQQFQRRFHRKTIFIPNGIGDEYFPDLHKADEILRSYQLPSEEYFIFVAGRIEPTKGAHLAIEAINQLPESKPLLIVGDLVQIPQYGQKLHGMAGPNIRFHPLLTDAPTLFGLMSLAKCLIFPSTVEAMSMVLLEVASLGVSIVCSDIPENRDVMLHDAVYFENGNVESLIEKLKWVLKNPKDVIERSDLAKERIHREYSWDLITSRYLEMYQQLINR